MPGFISYLNYCANLPDEAFTTTDGPYTGNVADLRTTRLSKGLSAAADDSLMNIRIDLGEDRDIGAVALFGINQMPSLCQPELTISSTSGHTGDVYNELATLPYQIKKPGKVIWLPTDIPAARYVQITIGASQSGRSVGMVWVGNRLNLPFDKNFTVDVSDNTVEYVSEGQETLLRKYAPARILEVIFPQILYAQALDGVSGDFNAACWQNLKWELGNKGFAVISPQIGSGLVNDERLRAFGSLYVAQPSRLKHENGPRYSASLIGREEVGHPGENIIASVPGPVIPPGDQWIAGERMWQDTSATVPADTEGDPVLSWTTVAGRKLTVVGAAMRAMTVQGTLTPCNAPTTTSFFLSDDQFDVRTLDVHLVVSQTAITKFGVGANGRLFELQGYTGGILAYDNSTVAVISPARFATRVPKTRIGITTGASGMQAWRDGVALSPASGRPATANRNIAIGDIDSTGGLATTFACAYQRVHIGAAADRDAVLAEQATYAALPSRPWCITYTDSQGVVVANASYTDGWHPCDGLNRRLNDDYNVVGISQSGASLGNVNTAGMFTAALQEIGVGESSAPDDGRALIFFVTNDLNLGAGQATAYEAAVTARADAYVAAFAFNAAQIVIVVPPYRYSPWDATAYNAQVDALAGLLVGSDYLVVDLRAVVTFAGGGIHTDGVHMTSAGVSAAKAAILAPL